MTETIASLIGAIVGAIITTSFWFVQHRIEQKDVLNNERRQDKRELVKNIMRNRMDQRALCVELNQIPLTFYDDPQAKELYRKLLETHDVATRDTILADLVNHLVVPEKLRTLDHGRPWSDDQFASTRLSSNRDMSR